MEWPVRNIVTTSHCTASTGTSHAYADFDANLQCSLINGILDDDEDQPCPGEEASTNSDCLSAGKWPDAGGEVGSEKTDMTGASTPGSGSEVSSFFIGGRPATSDSNSTSSVHRCVDDGSCLGAVGEARVCSGVSCRFRAPTPAGGQENSSFLMRLVPVPSAEDEQIDNAPLSPCPRPGSDFSDSLSGLLSSSLFSLVTAPGNGASSPREPEIDLPSLSFPPSQVTARDGSHSSTRQFVTDTSPVGSTRFPVQSSSAPFGNTPDLLFPAEEERLQGHFRSATLPAPAEREFSRTVGGLSWRSNWGTGDMANLDAKNSGRESIARGGGDAMSEQCQDRGQSYDKKAVGSGAKSREDQQTAPSAGLIGPSTEVRNSRRAGHAEADTSCTPAGGFGPGQTRGEELDTACLLLAALQPSHSLPPSHASQMSTACCTSVPSSPSKRTEPYLSLTGASGCDWLSPTSSSNSTWQSQLFPYYSEPIEAEPSREGRTASGIIGLGNCRTQDSPRRCSAVGRQLKGECNVAGELEYVGVRNSPKAPTCPGVLVGGSLYFAKEADSTRRSDRSPEGSRIGTDSADRATAMGHPAHEKNSLFIQTGTQQNDHLRQAVDSMQNHLFGNGFQLPEPSNIDCGKVAVAADNGGVRAIPEEPRALPGSEWMATVAGSSLTLGQGCDRGRTLQPLQSSLDASAVSMFRDSPSPARDVPFHASFQTTAYSRTPPQLPSSPCPPSVYPEPVPRSAPKMLRASPLQETGAYLADTPRRPQLVESRGWNSSSCGMHEERAGTTCHEQRRLAEHMSLAASSWRPDVSYGVSGRDHTEGLAVGPWSSDRRTVKPDRPKLSCGGVASAPLRGRLTLQEVLESPSPHACSLKFPDCELRDAGWSGSLTIESPMAATLGKLLAAYSGPSPASQPRSGCSLKPSKHRCLNEGEQLVRQGSYVVAGPEQAGRRSAHTPHPAHGWGKKPHQHQAGVTGAVAGQHRGQWRQTQEKALLGLASSMSSSVPQLDLQSPSAAGFERNYQSQSRGRGKN